MDVNLRLFSERLKRVLASEEGTLTLPDSTNLKPLFRNLLKETEIITTLLGNYEDDMALLLHQLCWKEGDMSDVRKSSNRLLKRVFGTITLPDSPNITPLVHLILTVSDITTTTLLMNYEGDLDRPDISRILKDVNFFVHESEKAIDTFFITIMQQRNNESACKELCDALVGLQSIIIGIRNQMQQIRPSDNHFISELKAKIQTGYSSLSEFNDMSEFEKGREELFDLLIEGPPRLSVVVILGSRGFDETAFATETYNNNHVKFYFDCLAWVRLPVINNFGKMLDDIIKSVMPPSRVSVIIGEDYKLKKTTLRDYLTNKKYFIVFDVCYCQKIWEDLEEVLPDNQNGSRVLVTVIDPCVLHPLELDNGEQISLDSLLVGGPLIRLKHKARQFFILHYGSTPLKNLIGEKLLHQAGPKHLSVLELPFHLKACCLYLSLFPPNTEICTRQICQLWVAEGLIPGNYNSEEMTEEYLKELSNRGLIQVTKRRAGGTIKACCVQTYVYGVLLIMGEQIEFVRSTFGYQELKLWKDIKRHSILENLYWFVSLNHSDTYIHSLLNFTSESDHPAIIDCMKICKKFKHLKVLNLGSLVLHKYPIGIENLYLLRYLKLNIPTLKRLPSFLCNLLNLYTLDMPSSYIDHTPEDIWKMHKLMHLNFGSITLPAPPQNYCSSLKNLTFISSLHPSSCTPDILGRLTNVQTLRITGDLSYHQYGVSKSMCKLQKLKCLKLVNEDKPTRIVLSEYQFPPSLTQLSLSNTKLKEDPLPTLGKLPLLQVLKLKQNSYSGRKLACVGSGGFPELKVLHLKSMYWLDEWTMGVGAMPKLESLIVNPCAYLRKLPEELWCIESFSRLELHWPQVELRKRLRVFEDMERRYEIKKYPYGI